MLKKFLLTSSLLTLTTGIAMASPAPYVGAGLGIVTTTSSFTATGTVPGTTTQVGQAANFRGVPVNVFVGFGGIVNQNLYLAGEVAGTLTTGEISNNGGLKTTYGYSASLLPGAMLSDHTLAFVRVGVARTHFSNANDTQTGAQLGLGLQTSVMQNIDLRGEYDFTAYGSFNNKYGRVSAPRSDAYNLGLVYKFD
jgi:opacity protein-like surface antigen